ncbi:MAG: tetratricopeptide repeat protein [Hyphomonadaceae bacterium]|nr:tetratricopeptide repeat protein [Hyphomonadaceae bacterium]
MVRHAIPRRSEKVRAAGFLPSLFAGAVLAGALLGGAMLVSGAGATAHAAGKDDAANERRERNKGAHTVLGAPASGDCAAAAAAGRSDDDAVSACDRAIIGERLNRANRIATLINRGAIHLRRRAGEQALADFDAVIALDSRHAEAHLNRGAALIMAGRPGPAVASITTALSLGVRYPHKAYFNRGAAREALGDVRGAYEDYNTALTIQPDWGPAEAELARFVRGRRERLAAQLGERPATSGQ